MSLWSAASPLRHRLLIFTAMTVLFGLLNYMGTALYDVAEGLSTVKPYSGVALALILILGESWLFPVLAAGTLGAMLVKLIGHAALIDILFTPPVASLTLYVMYRASRRLIGHGLDFRAWPELVAHIGLSIAVCAIASAVLSLIANLPGRMHFWHDWQSWFIPTALSYIIFTPVMVVIATTDKSELTRHRRRLAGCLVLTAMVLAINFLPSRFSLLFAIPMVLLIVTLIAELEGAALCLLLTELVLTGTVSLGHGPSAISAMTFGSQLYFVQIFLAILIGVMLPVAAALTERVKLRQSMEQALAREAKANHALRQSEQHARELAVEAQAANRAKSEFLASMSHELRTPLNAILGFSEIIQNEYYGPLGHAKYKEYAKDVYQSGAHLLDLINDVLDLSKIDAGKMELRESVFALRELVEETVNLVREKARNHVAIGLDIGAPFPVKADRRLIKQILLNLLTNAIKFTPTGGKVTIGAGYRPDGALAISVADTGVGMTEAELKKAFSQYGQIDSKIARAHQGTGLGLPISYALAKLHDGELLATSIPRQSTTMTLVLPERRILREEPLALFSVG